MVHDIIMRVKSFIFVLILWVSCINARTFSSFGPQSALCVKNDAPCSQDGSCKMLYFPVNSSNCADVRFANTKSSLNEMALGRVRINTYLYQDRGYSQTAFNLSFGNITWTKMKFRIIQEGNKGKNTCRQFIRMENSTLTSLAYDCIWSDEGYEGDPFILDYQAETEETQEAARIFFNVPVAPTSESIQDWRLLTYVEAIPLGLARTQFHLFWPTLSNVDFYRVYIYYNDSGFENILHTFDIRNCQDENLCKFETQKWFGKISFGVQPIFNNAVEGIISRTKNFDLGPDRVSPLLLTLVFCSIFVPIILYSALLLRKRILEKSIRAVPPKILIIHSPTTTPHLYVTEAFVNYLNTYCQVVALMDELDIPRTASRDPFLWCSEAISTADVVCVIASPFFGKLRSSSALYRTDRLLLRLLREQYGSGGKTRYCVVLPPYTSASDIPIEACSLRKFRMVSDIGKLVQMARYRWPIPQFFTSSTNGLQEQHGQELLDCIETAENDLKDHRDQYLIEAQEPERNVLCEQNAEPENLQQPSIAESHERTKDDNKILAREFFSDYLGNLEHLNLLGTKDEMEIVSAKRTPVSNINLDSLKL